MDKQKQQDFLDDSAWEAGLIFQLSLRSRFRTTKDNRDLVLLKIDSYDRKNLVLIDKETGSVFANKEDFTKRHEVEGVDKKYGFGVKYLFLEVNQFFRSSFPGATLFGWNGRCDLLCLFVEVAFFVLGKEIEIT